MYLKTYWEIPLFFFFTSFLTVSVTPFKNKPESSRDFTILISWISSFNIIGVVFVLWCEAEDEGQLWPDPKIFLCIPESAVDAAAVNPREIKTL